MRIVPGPNFAAVDAAMLALAQRIALLSIPSLIFVAVGSIIVRSFLFSFSLTNKGLMIGLEKQGVEIGEIFDTMWLEMDV